MWLKRRLTRRLTRNAPGQQFQLLRIDAGMLLRIVAIVGIPRDSHQDAARSKEVEHRSPAKLGDQENHHEWSDGRAEPGAGMLKALSKGAPADGQPAHQGA